MALAPGEYDKKTDALHRQVEMRMEGTAEEISAAPGEILDLANLLTGHHLFQGSAADGTKALVKKKFLESRGLTEMTGQDQAWSNSKVNRWGGQAISMALSGGVIGEAAKGAKALVVGTKAIGAAEATATAVKSAGTAETLASRAGKVSQWIGAQNPGSVFRSGAKNLAEKLETLTSSDYKITASLEKRAAATSQRLVDAAKVWKPTEKELLHIKSSSLLSAETKTAIETAAREAGGNMWKRAGNLASYFKTHANDIVRDAAINSASGLKSIAILPQKAIVSGLSDAWRLTKPATALKGMVKTAFGVGATFAEAETVKHKLQGTAGKGFIGAVAGEKNQTAARNIVASVTDIPVLGQIAKPIVDPVANFIGPAPDKGKNNPTTDSHGPSGSPKPNDSGDNALTDMFNSLSGQMKEHPFMAAIFGAIAAEVAGSVTGHQGLGTLAAVMIAGFALMESGVFGSGKGGKNPLMEMVENFLPQSKPAMQPT